jgi:hypothetical protein
MLLIGPQSAVTSSLWTPAGTIAAWQHYPLTLMMCESFTKSPG